MKRSRTIRITGIKDDSDFDNHFECLVSKLWYLVDGINEDHAKGMAQNIVSGDSFDLVVKGLTKESFASLL